MQIKLAGMISQVSLQGATFVMYSSLTYPIAPSIHKVLTLGPI